MGWGGVGCRDVMGGGWGGGGMGGGGGGGGWGGGGGGGGGGVQRASRPTDCATGCPNGVQTDRRPVVQLNI